MLIAGYFAALLIGLTLGLIGGGGSVITVPVLVYLLQVEPVMATAYSLFIVGTTSLAAVYPKYRQAEVDSKTALLFGLPSILMVYLSRVYILPAIPQIIFDQGTFLLTKGRFLLLVFALLMITASITMIVKSKPAPKTAHKSAYTSLLLVLLGLTEGLISGLVGAGGGFLIIPALVILAGLPMKKAIGTSLLIISVKSLVGFSGDLLTLDMDWNLLLWVTALAIIGVFLGNAWSSRLPAAKLKKAFGWFVLLMGIYILVREAIPVFNR